MSTEQAMSVARLLALQVLAVDQQQSALLTTWLVARAGRTSMRTTVCEIKSGARISAGGRVVEQGQGVAAVFRALLELPQSVSCALVGQPEQRGPRLDEFALQRRFEHVGVFG